MNQIITLFSLEKYLKECITPSELAGLIDDFVYDYYRISTRLFELEDEDRFFVHENTQSFIYNLKELKNVLLKCRETEITKN